MSNVSRRHGGNTQKRTATDPLDLSKAVTELQKFDPVKFDETVEVALRLGIDPRQTAQAVRGAFSLPHGTGKKLRVICFCEGDDATAAVEAGAIEAEGEELAKKVQGGWLDFDVAIAHPSMMRFVGKLGRILGPQGKMPSPKSGTVTADVATAVREFVAGKIEFRNDAGASAPCPRRQAQFHERAIGREHSRTDRAREDPPPDGYQGALHPQGVHQVDDVALGPCPGERVEGAEMARRIKELITRDLDRRFAGIEHAVMVDMSRLSGEDNRSYRTVLREAGISVNVVKNSLARRVEAGALSSEAAIQERREAIYSAIDDLDHDYETSKLDKADYTQMRDRLRAEAIELLRTERGGHAEAATTSAPTPIVSTLGSPDASAGASTTGAFCPNCGGKTLMSWRFCSHCGGRLNPPEEASG